MRLTGPYPRNRLPLSLSLWFFHFHELTSSSLFPPLTLFSLLPTIRSRFLPHRVTDAEAVAMSRHLTKADGLFLGSSSACNLVACVRAVRDGLVPQGGRIVTILCDSGNRHL